MSPTGAGRPLTALVVGVALVVGAVAIERRSDGPRFDSDPVVVGQPVVASRVEDTTWFCPALRHRVAGLTGGRIRLANIGADVRVATLVGSDSAGHSARRDVEVPGGTAVEVDVDGRGGLLTGSASLAVRVDVDGGGVAVEHSLVGIGGRSSAPCHTATARTWVTAAGQTERGTHLLLAVMNPSPSAAVMDVTTFTDTGLGRPRGLVGLVVPARSVRFVDLADHVRRRSQASSMVVVRAGRVVVDRVLDVSDAGRGTALGPALGGRVEWWFPDGAAGSGRTERLHLTNTGADPVEVDVEVVTDDDTVEPIVVTVGPQRTEIVDVGQTFGRGASRPHALAVRTLGNGLVVAEREIIATGGSGARGRSVTAGVSLATEWVVADGRATASVEQRLIVLNPSAVEATVTVTGLGSGPVRPTAGVDGFTVPARGRLVVRLNDHLREQVLALRVEATSPVAVERTLSAIGAIGMSAAPGLIVDRA